MSNQSKNNKGFNISKTTYILTLIFALLIGATGSYIGGNYFSNPANESDETLNELDSESDEYAQYLLDDSDEMTSGNKMLAILQSNYYKEVDTEVLIEEALEGMAKATGQPYTEDLNEQETT